MMNDIDKEHQMRQERMQDLDDQMTQDTSLTNLFLDNFSAKATKTATETMGDLEKELENRFTHQDKILGDMSVLVGKFQETLKVLGKDG